MAVRVTPAEVGLIIALDAKSVPDITSFIEVANDLVNDVCLSSSYSAAKLKLIELWLAAHFYAIRDPRSDSEKAGSVSKKVQYKIDLALSVTTYGQQAMVIDSAGNLARISKQAASGEKTKSIGVSWGGTNLYT